MPMTPERFKDNLSDAITQWERKAMQGEFHDREASDMFRLTTNKDFVEDLVRLAQRHGIVEGPR